MDGALRAHFKCNSPLGVPCCALKTPILCVRACTRAFLSQCSQYLPASATDYFQRNREMDGRKKRKGQRQRIKNDRNPSASDAPKYRKISPSQGSGQSKTLAITQKEYVDWHSSSQCSEYGCCCCCCCFYFDNFVYCLNIVIVIWTLAFQNGYTAIFMPPVVRCVFKCSFPNHIHAFLMYKKGT